jgi:hypothetical protein
MHDGHAADVLIVSLGSTEGLRRADRQLRHAIARAGVTASLIYAERPRERPTLMATDLAWALAARSALQATLRDRERPPRAIVYSSTTAALLWPRPGAVRFDATAAGNRPGRHGLWQRPLERLRLRRASLLLPWSQGAVAEAPAASDSARTIVVPVAVEPSGDTPGAERDVAAITYAANPRKKGLDRVVSAWRAVCEARGERDDELLVAGTSAAECARAGVRVDAPRMRLLDPMPSEAYRALVRRARVFVCAPRREDYGIAQLEALADGCQLVTTPAPGPYAALPIARAVDARLVTDDLAPALRTALEDPLPDYARRAEPLLSEFTPQALDRVVSEQLLPRLLG